MQRYWPSIIWTTALAALFCMDTAGSSTCIFRFAGLDHCPGCGLGHAIHEALHFRWASSLQFHLLGIPAIVFILIEIVKPFFINKTTIKWTSKFS